MSRLAPLAGPMLADVLRYAIAIVLTFSTGWVMGYRPDGGAFGVLGASVLLIIAGWSLGWVFCWIGSIARSAQGTAARIGDI